VKLWCYVVYLGGVLALGFYGFMRSWNVGRVDQVAVPAGR
jgi:hypothetical protein